MRMCKASLNHCHGTACNNCGLASLWPAHCPSSCCTLLPFAFAQKLSTRVYRTAEGPRLWIKGKHMHQSNRSWKSDAKWTSQGKQENKYFFFCKGWQNVYLRPWFKIALSRISQIKNLPMVWPLTPPSLPLPPFAPNPKQRTWIFIFGGLQSLPIFI